MSRTLRYFAYGSNMYAEKMRAICPSAKRMGIARLSGFMFCFPRTSPRWQNRGVAGILPGNGEIFGVLWEINESELPNLDDWEKNGTRYRRTDVEVLLLPNNRRIPAFTYIPIPEPGGPFPPLPEYARKVIQGAIDAGLPEKYIEQIRRKIKELGVEI